MRIKIQQMNLDIFFNQTLLKSVDCLFKILQMKMEMLKDLMLEDITYQKELLIILMSSSMEKSFMIN